MIDRTIAAVLLLGCIALGFALFTTRGELQAQKLAYSQLETQAEKERKQAAEAYAKGLQDLRDQQQIITDKYQGALNDARTREATSRRHADLAAAESSGLRAQLLSAARLIADAATPAASVAEYAAVANRLLDNCQQEYQELGSTAQGHANDVRTLLDAWPMNKK